MCVYVHIRYYGRIIPTLFCTVSKIAIIVFSIFTYRKLLFINSVKQMLLGLGICRIKREIMFI